MYKVTKYEYLQQIELPENDLYDMNHQWLLLSYCIYCNEESYTFELNFSMN